MRSARVLASHGGRRDSVRPPISHCGTKSVSGPSISSANASYMGVADDIDLLGGVNTVWMVYS